jgi:putative oxidoreductase
LGEQEEAVFQHVAAFTPYSLLLLRVMVGLVFADSGYNDLKDPGARAASLGLPKSITVFLAVAELLGALAVTFGVLTQLACIGLILIMLGAIQKKIFVWKTGFWGKNGLGWNYELIFVSILLVIFCTDGGRLTLFR